MVEDRKAILDDMIEFAMEELLSGSPARQRDLVRTMAERWPDQPALGLVYALASATAAIEDQFGAAAGSDPSIPAGYRLAALSAADIHAVEAMGQSPARAEDLLHFWRRAAPDFLDR